MGRSTIASWVRDWFLAVNGTKVFFGDRRTIQICVREGPLTAFEVIHVPRINPTDATEIAKSAPAGTRFLVASNRLSLPVRHALEAHDASWLDRRSGECYIAGPGMLLERQGPQFAAPQRSVKRPNTTPRLQGKCAHVAHTLLGNGEGDEVAEPIVLSQIVERSGASKGLVSRVLRRLTNLGMLRVEGTAPRCHWLMNDRGALLRLLLDENPPEHLRIVDGGISIPTDIVERCARESDRGQSRDCVSETV